MISIDGRPPFGAPPSDEMLSRFETAVTDRTPEAGRSLMRHIMADAYAMACGLRDGLDDPFTAMPRAMAALETRVETLEATSEISASQWKRSHGYGEAAARGGYGPHPDRLAALALWIERHANAEEKALTMVMLLSGMDEGDAESVASATIATGIGIAIAGEPERRASALARGNQRALRGYGPAAAEAARLQQAACLRRYMRISDLDDLEEATEDATAVSRAIKSRFIDQSDNAQPLFRT